MTLLCPSKFFTCTMSLVLWYSIVAFQCLKVWNVILCILGFCSFLLAVFRCTQKFVLSAWVAVPNMCSLFRGIWFIMFRSLSLMCRSRGLLPLAGVMFSVFCCVSRSCHLSFVSSDILMAVSLSVWSSVAVCFWHAAISWSISVSVGMKGNLVSGFMRGRFHVLPMYLRKAS